MTAIGEGRGEQRNAGIDLFRGVLVLAVIAGHYSELTTQRSLLTWIGAGFRMPVFIGLTGYMFNLERARAMPVLMLLRRYWQRLILPWVVACMVHLTVTGQFNLMSPITMIFHPAFHLWFVPVMLAFIVVAAVSRSTPTIMLAIATPTSIAAMYLLGLGHHVNISIHWMPDLRFFIYPIYFFFGLWLSCRLVNPRETPVATVLAVIGILWWCRLYYRPILVSEIAAELILGISLISLLPNVRNIPLMAPPVVDIGRQSLFFYLWHPMIFALWASCGVGGIAMLVLSLSTLLVLRVGLARAPRLAWTFGIIPRRHRPDVPDTLTIVTPLHGPAL